MKKVKYLNVGCGSKLHEAWINVDMVPTNPLLQCDLTKGINFPDNTFEVIYHPQMIEHIPNKDVLYFINECYRVLQPGGIMRIVTPDLERITRDYIFYLEECLLNPSEENSANYDWVFLEMCDRAIRNSSRGQLAEVIGRKNLLN